MRQRIARSESPDRAIRRSGDRVKTLQTRRYGKFRTTIKHRKRASYRVVYRGGPGLVGKASARHRW